MAEKWYLKEKQIDLMGREFAVREQAAEAMERFIQASVAHESLVQKTIEAIKDKEAEHPSTDALFESRYAVLTSVLANPLDGKGIPTAAWLRQNLSPRHLNELVALQNKLNGAQEAAEDFLTRWRGGESQAAETPAASPTPDPSPGSTSADPSPESTAE